MTEPPDSPGQRGSPSDPDPAQPEARSVDELSIRLLGGFAAEVDGKPLGSLSSGRVQALLAYLLLHRGVPLARRQLAFLFWPDTTDAQAQANLRTLLHRLRRALPEPGRFLDADVHTLLWREDDRLRLDVAEFEAATADEAPLSELHRGIEMFRGDLLPELYDPWVEPERERLHTRFMRAAERACRVCEAHRDYQAALDLAQRLARHDPLDEESYRRLMRLHALAGERTAALRVFHECEELFERELGVATEPATRELYERLVADRPSTDVFATHQATAHEKRLIGRFSEFERLQRAWREALVGSARLAQIVGEPGIGKTRLAGELADWVGRQGFPVARGRAYAAEGELAYAPIVPWVRSGIAAGDPARMDPLWLAELSRVLPELATRHPRLPSPPPISEPGEQERFAEALVRGVLARRVPVLLLLDDMQWCAPEALGWIHYLLRTNASAPILVLGTVRSGEAEANPALDQLATALEREDRLRTVTLAALSEAESERLAAAVSGEKAPPPPAVYRGAGGNPLFIVEMVRFHEGRSIADVDRTVPPTVSGIIRARLAQLSDDSRHLLRCAAVVGRRAPLSLIAEIAQLEGSRSARSLDELQARGIVEEGEPGQIEIAHDVIRDHAYAEIGPTLRRHLHGAAAEALQSSAPEPRPLSAEIAAHFDRAERPDSAVKHYLDAANVSLRTGASEEALRLLRRTLELAEAEGAVPVRARSAAGEIRERLADVLYLTGRYADSRAVLEAALERARGPLQRARLSRRLGKAAIGERNLAAALEALDDAARLLELAQGTPDDRREWLQVQLDRMSVQYWLGDWRAMEKVARAMGPVLAQFGSAEQRRQHDWQIVGMSLRRDRYVVSDEMVALARGILRSTIEDGYAPRIAVASFHLAFALLWHGDLAEARTEAERALDLAGRSGDLSLELRCLTYLAVIGRLMRDTVAVRDYAQRAEAAAMAMGHREYLGAAYANRAWLAWHNGDRVEALALGRAATSAWEPTTDSSPGFMFEWLGLLVLIALGLQRRGTAPVGEAVKQARRLLDLSQQRLADPIVERLEMAIRDWESGDRSAARVRLRDALSLGRDAKLI